MSRNIYSGPTGNPFENNNLTLPSLDSTIGFPCPDLTPGAKHPAMKEGNSLATESCAKVEALPPTNTPTVTSHAPTVALMVDSDAWGAAAGTEQTLLAQWAAKRAEMAEVQSDWEMDWMGASPQVGVAKVISPRETTAWRGRSDAEVAVVANADRAAARVRSWGLCMFAVIA